MDEIDRSLLETLQENATLSIAQMAERVGLSPTPCWKRIQKLEAAGSLCAGLRWSIRSVSASVFRFSSASRPASIAGVAAAVQRRGSRHA